MATLGELKAQMKFHDDASRDLAIRIRKLEARIKAKKQATCPHTKTFEEREAGYFEPGKMTHPLPDTRYETCCRCKKRLGRYSSGPEKLIKLT